MQSSNFTQLAGDKILEVLQTYINLKKINLSHCKLPQPYLVLILIWYLDTPVPFNTSTLVSIKIVHNMKAQNKIVHALDQIPIYMHNLPIYL